MLLSEVLEMLDCEIIEIHRALKLEEEAHKALVGHSTFQTWRVGQALSVLGKVPVDVETDSDNAIKSARESGVRIVNLRTVVEQIAKAMAAVELALDAKCDADCFEFTVKNP